MKRMYVLLSFLFLLFCFMYPLIIFMAMNGAFGAFGEFTVFLWPVFPILGVLSAIFGGKGRIKVAGIMLNGTALCLVLLITFVRLG
ncbi:hypothetical protein [Bacillus sp. MMSF_3328]|uniref:hypothetical protein n=1 Tax=Bacillus sp. MMSF_3328 TaxID=3047080 RepID=UPI00274021A6|nr:hypothetical protein [Bacillus sp. MMSF_3328]